MCVCLRVCVCTHTTARACVCVCACFNNMWRAVIMETPTPSKSDDSDDSRLLEKHSNCPGLQDSEGSRSVGREIKAQSHFLPFLPLPLTPPPCFERVRGRNGFGPKSAQNVPSLRPSPLTYSSPALSAPQHSSQSSKGAQ